MAVPPVPPATLEYQRPSTHRIFERAKIVAAIGAVTAFVGVGVFLAAHWLSTRSYGYMDEQLLHEAEWVTFAITLLLVGGIIAAIGLAYWCRDRLK